MEDVKKLDSVLSEVGRARQENEYFGKLLDEGVDALKAEFGEEKSSAQFPVALERQFYEKAIELLTEIAAMPEKEAVEFSDDGDKLRFGILLSGILSNQNGHRLDALDVEDHEPRCERNVRKILTREYCIDDGDELKSMVSRLIDGDYSKRFSRYASAGSAEELFDDDMDELDRSSESRAWRFCKAFEGSVSGEGLSAWDLGRAAMLVRWGAFVGYVTRKEADDFLCIMADKAAELFTSFRAFSQSYILGALLYKFICEEPDADVFLDAIFDSVCELLRGDASDNIGQWKYFGFRAHPRCIK
ncbi:MAG: DUF1266 domain-containing protein [Lachnospiraceae bacterium]|nr:DUF1266 domain-containing protein [Lachnospiraceae bacterium]